MRLPRGHRAVIDGRKLRLYLLSTRHPVGRSKAAYFLALGFDPAAWEVLASALLEHAKVAAAEPAGSTPFGRKYRTRGRLATPSGRIADVVVVWIVRAGEDVPRFVTAYPRRRR